MLEFTEIRPYWGSALEINYQDGAGNNIYPMTHFEITTAMDESVTGAKKLAAHGEWKKFNYPGAMTIVAEGDILGIQGAVDADAAEDYVEKRLALLAAVVPPYPNVQTNRAHGHFRIKMTGMDEYADAEIQLRSQSMPLQASQPARSDYSITWVGFLPVFIGVTSGDPYLLG